MVKSSAACSMLLHDGHIALQCHLHVCMGKFLNRDVVRRRMVIGVGVWLSIPGTAKNWHKPPRMCININMQVTGHVMHWI